MTEDVYRALAQRLDQIPNGFPPTESGAELRLLARLFRPEEAALAVHLRLTPEPASVIAGRSGGEEKAAYALLKGMARRGLIAAERGRQGLLFGLMPFVVGFYEMQRPNLDAELAALFEAYVREAFPAMLAVQPALQRVIPVEEAVPIDVEILPYERASQILDGAAAWGLVDCICRRQQKLLGKGCEAPEQLCMVLSNTPGAFAQAAGVQALTREEAGLALRRAEEAGLVHSTSNTQGSISYICNCCTCCCGILRGVAEFGIRQSVAHSAFWATVDEERCAGCGACAERCRFGALQVEGNLCRVDCDRCAGCGLCASACHTGALQLQRRPADQVQPIPPDMPAWLAERARARGIDLHTIL